jgi:hypothetical protein
MYRKGVWFLSHEKSPGIALIHLKNMPPVIMSFSVQYGHAVDL